MSKHLSPLQKAIAVLAFAFVCLWAAYGVPLQNLIYDPSFYYAHVRSPLIDYDLDFANEGMPADLVAYRTKTGLVPSLWSVGPAIVWSPFVLLAHGLSLAAQNMGVPTVSDGYSPIYLTLCALGSAFWGWLGVVACYFLARSVADSGPALLAALAVWLASPLFFFMYRIQLYAHAPTVAFIAATLCVWLYLQRDPVQLWSWLLLGLLIGMATLMRWQNGLFALLVPFVFPARSVHAPQLSWRALLVRLTATACGIAIGFAPQMIVWWRLYGDALSLPQGNSFFHWLQPQLWLVLFGSNRGLFVWQPLTLVGLIGLFMYGWRNRWSGLALLLVAALETYLNSVVTDWWGGGGYGPRRFDWLLPMLAIGVALVFQTNWSQRGWRLAMCLLVGLLVFHQLALAQSYYYRIMPDGQPFPISPYDQGLPLPDGFFASLMLQTLRRPAFLLEVSSSFWGNAPPLWLALVRMAQAAPIDAQAVASCVATLVAVLVAWSVWRWLPAMIAGRVGLTLLSRRVTMCCLAMLSIASLVFFFIGS